MGAFLEHFENFQKHYCGHFDGIDEVFTRRIDSLNELKVSLNQQLVKIREQKQANERAKGELDSKLTSIRGTNQRIQAAVQRIQTKVRAITCPFPDDLVLQVFISELADKVETRKSNVNSCLLRTSNTMAH